MTVRFYELLDGKSHKFWEARLQGAEVTLRYGKWRSSGTEKTRKYKSSAEARVEFARTCKAKEKDGYVASDPDFSVGLRAELERAKKKGMTEFSINTHHPEALAMVCEITTLTDLTVSCHEPAVLPEALGDLKALQSLDVNQCGLTALPERIGELKELRYLYCYLNEIRRLPESLCACTKLEKISAWSNSLTELPEGIGALVKLEELELHRNQLTRLPASIGDLEKLEELEIHDNQLTELPPEIGRLRALKLLDLNENPLEALPGEIGQMAALEELGLGETKITALPDDIGQCRSLVKIWTDGYDNQPLASLPESLAGLPNLNTLELPYCSFTAVPEVLKLLPALESVSFYENPIEGIDEDLLDDKDALFECLGWVQEGAVTVDSERFTAPDEDRRKAIVTARMPALKAFRREVSLVRGRITDEVIAYLSGETDELPNVKAADAQHMEDLELVFAPWAEWTFIDERALGLCATRWRYKTHSYHSGFHEAFGRWLRKTVVEHDDPGLFPGVMERLLEYGLSEDEVVLGVFDEAAKSLVVDGRVTSVGQTIAKLCERRGADVVAWAKEESARAPLTRALLQCGDIGPHLHDLLESSEYNDMLHPPLPTVRALVEHDPEQYLQIVLDALEGSSSGCLVCFNELSQILAEHGGEAHRERSLELTGRALKMISDKRNNQDSSFFNIDNKRYASDTHQYIEWIFKRFGKDARDMVVDFVENTHVMDLDVVEVAARYLGQDGLPIVAEALEMKLKKGLGGHFRRVFEILRNLDYSAHYDTVWELAGCEFGEVQDAAARALAWREGDHFERARDGVAAKNKAERHGAVKVLAAMGSEASLEVLAGVIDGEKNDDIRDTMVGALYGRPETILREEADRRVAASAARGKLHRWARKWLEGAELPGLTYRDGTTLGDDAMRFLVYRQGRFDDYELDPEVRDVVALLEPESAAAFAVVLYRGVLENGGVAAKNRPLLSLVAALADDSLVDEWQALGIDRNENAIRMLGMGHSITAARALDRIRRQYQVKYPNVREAAEQAMLSVANRMELGGDELPDKLVPDLGFRHGVREFTIDDEVFRTRIGTSLRLEFIRPTGKIVKSVPKKASATVKAAYKSLGKELTAAVKEYRPVVEDWLVTRRRWNTEAWSGLFLDNALMNAVAQGLVWGLFHDGQLVSPFVLNADRTLETTDGNRVSLLGPHWVGDFEMMLGMVRPKPFADRKREIEIRVGLMHPIDLDEEPRQRWQQVLDARKITPYIPQLTRPVLTPDEREAQARISFRFEDTEVDGRTFKARASRLGWRRGSVVDAGAVSSYYKHFPEDGIDAFLTVDSLGVGDSYEDAVMKQLFFVPHGSVVTGSYMYDEPRSERDERLIAPPEVPPVVFSETVGNVLKILGEE